MSLFALVLLLGVIAAGPSGALGALLSALSPGSGTANSVVATGSGDSGPLEDFVELTWQVDTPIGVTDFFEITRGTTLLHVAASTESLFEDRSAVPAITYNYCVDLVSTAGVKTRIGCADGSRLIARPTSFEATDGTSEQYVGLSWADQSSIETGYNVYREGGKALKLDGTGGYAQIESISLEGSFTIELWASRAMGSTDDVLIKLETPQGPNRADPPFEVSFDNTNALTAVYGFEELKLPAAVSDIAWHHWAIAFDQDTMRWYIYRDGVLVADDALSVDFLSRGPLLVGRRVYNQNGFRVPVAGRGYFDGAVDEIRLWDIALTEEQVASRMLTMLNGSETGLVNYWSMDDAATLTVRDLVGGSPGTIRTQTSTASVISSGLPAFLNTVGPNITSFVDRLALPGYGDANGDGVHTPDEPIYTYILKAFVDVDGDGEFTAGVDYESESRTDEGWRAILTPPANVMATDGQFSDKVRITWVDLASSENGYRIYRDGVELTTTLPNVQQYDDTGAIGQQEYCVAAFAGAVESAPGCDYGRMDLLAPPADVTATSEVFDDRVEVAWTDTTSTEDGFEVYRDNVLLATLGADEEAYADLSAVQSVEYDYCVLAFSKADLLNIVRSAQTCAPNKGIRAAILAPTGLTASQATFEDRVELSWANPATTTLLFKVLRDNQVIEILDFNTKTATDFEIASDTDYEYSVIGVTVVQPAATQQRQGQVAQLLEFMKTANAVGASTGGEVMSAGETLSAIYAELGLDTAGKSALGATGVVESAAIVATGSRSLHPPTGLEATLNEFEDHVQLDWTDNSSAETNYVIYRTPLDDLGVPTAPEALVNTLSANRTTYGDYTGVPGVPYLYRILAIDDYGFSASATAPGIRTLVQPTQFVASDGISEEIVFLDWADNSDAEDGYHIYRREVGGAWGAPAASTGKNEPAYEDRLSTDLMGLTLEYGITAFDAYGESLMAIDTGYTMIEAPGDVSASDGYDASVVVVWVDRSVVEEGYTVSRREQDEPLASAVTLAAALPPNTTEFSDAAVVVGKTYVYCVWSTRGAVPSVESCDTGSLASAPPPGGGGGVSDVQRIFRSDLAGLGPNDWDFGYSVAADGAGTVVIGAPGGLVLGAVTEYDSDTWAIGPTTSDKSEFYGRSVFVNGAYTVAAAGATVYMYDRGTDTEVKTWAVPGGADSNYSPTVANDGAWVLIGDPSKLATRGGAALCHKDTATCVDLTVVGGASPLSAGDQFGRAVALHQVTRDLPGGAATADILVAAVGAPGNGQSKTHALVFECPLTGPGADPTDPCTEVADWAQVKKVSGAGSLVAGSTFGRSLAIDEDNLIVSDDNSGAFELWQVVGVTAAGVATSWEQKKIVNQPTDSARSTAGFGWSVSIRGDVILVGAPFATPASGGFVSSGAAYVYSLASIEADDFDPRFAYDARTGAGSLAGSAHFGTSVSLGDDFYLIGAPDEDGGGAVYAIAFDTTPVVGPPPPEDTVLLAATGVSASDGRAPDRIQIRWTDEAEKEDGQIVYRSRIGGELERLAEIEADVVFYDDFSAAPGDAYTYCVSAYAASGGEILESDKACDIGWRPANGTIAGLVAPAHGGATEGVDVCLSPSPNAALLLDGLGGYLQGIAPEDAVMPAQFTIEAWVRLHGSGSGEQFIAVRDSSFALALVDGDIQIETRVSGGTGLESYTVDSNLAPGAWHHIAVTRDVASDTRAYVMGAQVGTTKDGALLLNTAEAGDTLRIGRNGLSGESDGFFSGEIDEVRLWSHAKTAAQLSAAYPSVLQGDEEALVGYWPLDQGARLVAPDVSESAIHVNFLGGAYIAAIGAPVAVCDVTDSEGQFSLSQIRYGETTEFKVVPAMGVREFEPGFAKVTLATDSPVQNQVFFVDVTAFTVTGSTQYTDAGPNAFTCPAPRVGIHVSKDGVVLDETLKATTGADGSFAIALDPSEDHTDPWILTPRFTGGVNAQGEQVTIVHSYTDSELSLVVEDNIFDLLFEDNFRNTLSGSFSGGDPDPLICQKDVGIAELHIYTQDGCYDRVIEVNSQAMGAGDFNIDFSLGLPPLEYLVDVVSVKDGSGTPLTDVEEFFQDLGTREVDLTQGDAELNLTYRAPLVFIVAGLEPPPMCALTGIDQLDDGQVIRTLPNVATLGEYEFRDLTFSVSEDYGGGSLCPVNDGTLTIFDAISDRVDADSTISLENGVANYTVIGTSPNIYSGARIGGVDRSFQKPITVVAEVEGRDPMTVTEWAIVEGFRERAATFVSATTEEFPLLIVHDPPGSNSYAYVEEGSTFCHSFASTMTLGGSGGIDFEIKFGFEQSLITAPLGIGIGIDTAGGFALNIGFNAGQDVTSLGSGPNREVCLTTTETFTTWDDWGNVGEDLHMGVALNLIFAIADVLEVDDGNVCKLSLSETLAGDINEAIPFETSYAYGKTHIARSLIPDLEKLIELAGDDTAITGELEGQQTTIHLANALNNWRSQLSNSENLQATALENPLINRSFSAASTFEYSEQVDTSRVTYFDETRVFLSASLAAGPTFEIAGNEAELLLSGEIHSEWVTTEERTEATTSKVGYVLSDGDAGDYFSVDIAKNPRYGTYVFGTRSGRSSFPWELNTQKRDNPLISVDPPVLFNVPANGSGTFDLTLINGTESDEQRQYEIGVPGELNPYGLGIAVSGSAIGAGRTESYVIQPGTALTVSLDVKRGPSEFSYERSGVMIYPKEEMEIWDLDRRDALVLSDTAFFSIHYDQSPALVYLLAQGWTWFSINRPGGRIEEVMGEMPVSHGDLIVDRTSEARYDSTAGWTGTLQEMVPGEAYRVHLKEPGLFYRPGDPIVVLEPTELTPGWNWIGYLPGQSMPVADALVSLADRLIDGDAVVSQHGFAQFVTGVGWVGTLRDMEPGEAYQLYLAGGGSLLYPEAPEVAALRDPEIRTVTINGPEWEVEAEEYGSSMVIVAEIAMLGAPLEQTTTKVAVMSGDDVRGVADVRWVESLERYLAFIQVYGDYESDDLFRVHVYNGDADMLYEDVASVRFEAQTILGSASAPLTLEMTLAGQAPELVDLPAEFALYPNYPNPFNPQTVIAYDLPETGQVTLRVYDAIGRLVSTLVNGEQTPGRYSVAFDARNYASGLYLYRLNYGAKVAMGKMLLVK
jgi:Concanavalin A-like lectin/glucanases superfamily/FG-GAP repeat/Secretion system C-terminal sorting domain